MPDERLEMRPVRTADADSLFAAIAGTSVTDTIAWDGPNSLDEYRAVLGRREREVSAGVGHTFTAVERSTGRPVGTAMLRHAADPDCADLGLWIDPWVQGRGYGTEAVRWLVRYGFNRLGLFRIEARIFVDDAVSRRVVEKSGFAFDQTLRGSVTKRGRALDEWLFALERPPALLLTPPLRLPPAWATMAMATERHWDALGRSRATPRRPRRKPN